MTSQRPDHKKFSLGDIAERVSGRVIGDADLLIGGIGGIREAAKGEITFVSNPKYLPLLKKTRASAVIVAEPVKELVLSQLVVGNPYYAYSQLVRLLFAEPYAPSGINPAAVIGRNVSLGADLSIHPFVSIGDGAVIGDRVTLYPGVSIGAGSSIGKDSTLHANVSVREHVRIGERVIIHSGTVIGSDGFGFATHEGRHHKILQVGKVRIEDDVEIGANCTVDRAALGETVIGRGTKIDNLVQVAHNVRIGEHCILVAQVGVSGSTEIGNFVTLAGQVGVVGHVRLGDRVIVGAKSGVSKDIEEGEAVSGIPALPHRRWLAAQASFARLPELRKRIGSLEKKMASLEEKMRPPKSGKRGK